MGMYHRIFVPEHSESVYWNKTSTELRKNCPKHMRKSPFLACWHGGEPRPDDEIRTGCVLQEFCRDLGQVDWFLGYADAQEDTNWWRYVPYWRQLGLVRTPEPFTLTPYPHTWLSGKAIDLFSAWYSAREDLADEASSAEAEGLRTWLHPLRVAVKNFASVGSRVYLYGDDLEEPNPMFDLQIAPNGDRRLHLLTNDWNDVKAFNEAFPCYKADTERENWKPRGVLRCTEAEALEMLAPYKEPK